MSEKIIFERFFQISKHFGCLLAVHQKWARGFDIVFSGEWCISDTRKIDVAAPEPFCNALGTKLIDTFTYNRYAKTDSNSKSIGDCFFISFKTLDAFSPNCLYESAECLWSSHHASISGIKNSDTALKLANVIAEFIKYTIASFFDEISRNNEVKNLVNWSKSHV